jgi:hypothetical protein
MKGIVREVEGMPTGHDRQRLVGIVFTGFSARLIDLQVVKHQEHTKTRRPKHSIRSRCLRIAE